MPRRLSEPFRRQPGYILKRASAAMLGRLNRRLELIGCRHVEAAVISLMLSKEGVTQSAIGRTLGIQSANMAPLIARLARRGWVDKRPIDGKSLGLFFTETGREAAGQIKKAMEIEEDFIRERVPDEFLPHFIEILEGIWRDADSL